LDSGSGEGGISGEPSQAFVEFVARVLPQDDSLHDVGCSTGCFLHEVGTKRPDLVLSGVESDLTRVNMAVYLHKDLPTKIWQDDILSMEKLDAGVTSVFMHDTAWTDNVVAKSTLLMLTSPSLRIIICVRPRPELEASGKFAATEHFVFSLRGGNVTRTATVFKAITALTIPQLRVMVAAHTENNFSNDRDFYVGETESEKRSDMEVRPSDLRLLAKL
jgi:hypothetical protein